MKNTIVHISDAGCATQFEHDGRGFTAVVSGGCPVEKLLADIDWSLPLEDLARAILAAWEDGYDGDPHESGLTVLVSRTGEQQVMIQS
jgi:hypothetical protein